MSAIDSLTHYHVGNFFGIPVYWVIEESKLSMITDIDYEDGYDAINKNFLCIGGGRGEHPALIVNNDAIIFNFLQRNEVDVTKQPRGCFVDYNFDLKVSKLVEKILERYPDNSEMLDWKAGIDTNQWPLKTFIRIAKEYEEKLSNNDTLESRIIDSIALFLIYEMPLDHYCIVDDDIL